MNELSTIPKWFWISLGVILVVTIGVTMYCNYKAKEKAFDVANTINGTDTVDPLANSISALNFTNT